MEFALIYSHPIALVAGTTRHKGDKKMKAKQTLIAIISSLVLFPVSATKVSASDSVSDVVVIKSVSCYGNSCTVFFDDAVIRGVIPNIAEYRICIDGEACPKNWWTLRQSVSRNSGDFPLGIGKSGSFRFHILTTDLRNIWSPSPITITNTSTVDKDFFAPTTTTTTTKIQPIVITATTIATYVKLTWRNAGCNDLSEVNKKWADYDLGNGWKNYWVESAKDIIDLQNNPEWNVLYGEPQNRKYQYGYIGFGCSNKLAYEIKKINVREFVWQYTLCNDGWHSSSVGSGTCSWHGGIHSYRGYYKNVQRERIQFYWKY